MTPTICSPKCSRPDGASSVTIKGEYSEDGTEWKDVEDTSTGAARGTRPPLVDIKMNHSVHVGLAVCSHAGPGIPAEAKMSNVATTGDIDPPGEFPTFEGIGFE